MPFASKAQQGFMFAKRPKIAKKWADKYGVHKDLPKKKESPWAKMAKKKG